MSRNPQSLWRTEHEDTQGQREETGTVPSGDGYGGHSRDGTLTQDNMSLMRERRGGGAGREGGLAGTGLQTQKLAPKPLLFWAVIPGITLSPLMPL